EEISLDNPKDTESLELQNILSEIQLYKEEKLTWEIFERLSQKIIAIFSEQNDTMINDPHKISNLALLGHNENAALNNSVFEVKRRAIINMDKEGSYIPVCTKRVFMKYYISKNKSQQYYFWGHDDRASYLEE